jgi:predicted DNA-binding protein with PD1-like motif
MQIARAGSVLMLRLDHGEDILASIGSAVKDEKSTMLVVTGLGMLSDFELGFFDRGSYIRREYPDPHELLSLQGSIAAEGEPRIHIHATVADTEHRAFGGHLMRGKAWMSNEIGLLRLEGHRSSRIFDNDKRVGVLRI